jgi:solute:Na+ symporter, SSS family
MNLHTGDVVAFLGFIALVVGVSLYQGRKEETSEDYFLAGRNLTWWLIGFSLIASNISTEHFVGMAGSGFGVSGLAVASYEWIAAASLVFVGLWLLPRYLELGIYTMPEFLEHRFGPAARTLMAVYMLLAYVGVAMAAVLYSGALGLATIFDVPLVTGIWLIGLLAGAYTIYGGLKAVVWSDLIQGAALLLGGATVMVLGFQRVGGVGAFLETNADKLHVILPADHPEIPWTALLLGIWIPNFFYWGFNQFITQRTLGAKSLRAGQRGIMLAAGIKLLIPFIIIFPGIMAFQLFGDRIADGDQAYAVLIQEVLPPGLRGILFAALFGAVMSSLDSMLNSASTIFTMDIYRRRWRPDAETHQLVTVGRVATAVLVVASCLLAPLPGRFEGVFNYIQMIWGFVSPGVVAVFFFGFLVPRTPTVAAMAGLVIGVPIYGALLALMPEVAFLNHMAATFVVIVAVMTALTLLRPRSEPFRFERRSELPLERDPLALPVGALILVAIAGLYVFFR